MTPLPATLDEAHETIRQLRDALTPRQEPQFEGLHLHPQESLVVALLLETHGFVTTARIHACFDNASRRTVFPEIVLDDVRARVAAFRVRRKLAPHGITIVSSYGRGYSMPADSKARLRALEIMQ